MKKKEKTQVILAPGRSLESKQAQILSHSTLRKVADPSS